MILSAATGRSAHSPRPTRRALLVFALVVTVLAWLLAMHTVSTSPASAAHEGSVTHGSSPADGTAPTAQHGGGAAVANAHGTTASGALYCESGFCGDGGPDHSMLAMVCAMAMLAVTLVLAAPRLLARLSVAMARTCLGFSLRSVWVVMPPLRPPSLNMLSISRT